MKRISNMTQGYVKVFEPDNSGVVYLYRNYSGYPDGLGKDISFVLKHAYYPHYYLDIATYLIKQNFIGLELLAYNYNPESHAEYLYEVNAKTLEITVYHGRKKLRKKL